MSLRSVRPKALVEGVFWLVVIGLVASRMWPQLAAAFGVASSNGRAPDFHVTTLAGEPLSRDALRGKVVLVNFWATWCAPCRIEMPGFQKVYERRRDQGFTIVGISTDVTSPDLVALFLHERGITYPVAVAEGAVVRDFGGATVLPTSFLIDREGRIRNEVHGIFTSIALEQAVERLLAEPAPTAASVPAGSGR